MNSYEHYHQLLKLEFAPLLRGDGFKGSGNTYRRFVGDRIDVIDVQGSRYGGECCVNLGVHFSFLPSEGGLVTESKTLKHYHCTFRERLHEATESDHWWRYGESEAEAQTSVRSLCGVYRRRGGVFFAKFEPFPDMFEWIRPVDIEAGDLTKMPAPLTLTYAALVMARIMKWLGNSAKCREFAEVGLRKLGRAVGLQAELEELRDGL
jgi:hypothetical protein